jgi:hypothetical protein
MSASQAGSSITGREQAEHCGPSTGWILRGVANLFLQNFNAIFNAYLCHGVGIIVARKNIVVKLLNVNAGFLDTVGFFGLQGQFVAHVIGNFVTLVAALVFRNLRHNR